MSTLSNEDISRLSILSNLDITKKESESLKQELSDVVSYFDSLKEISTDELTPTSQTTGLQDVLRDDEIVVTRILPESDSISGTDQVYNNLFVVPQVIDKEQ